MSFPLHIIGELGHADPQLGQALAGRAEEFRQRRLAFDWVHLGMTDLPVGHLLDLIQREPRLLPPRTGHMGNWEEIARGRAGAMDFNTAICAQGFGYPLIYCFNQTEDQALQGGDWVYMPGSLVEQGQRTELPLFTWDGAGFSRRTRQTPLFTPFVLTEVAGDLVPLTRLHWQRMRQFQGFRFRLEAGVIRQHEPLVREILHVLLESSAGQDNQRRFLQDLLSHQAGLDGQIARCEIERAGHGYRMGPITYASAAELVDAAMLPFLAASDPEQFFARASELPTHMPVMANVLVSMLSAMLSTHYVDGPIDRATMTQPFNPHFHWGARAMAGYPPIKKGYFAEKSTARSCRKICQTVIEHFAEIDPVCMLLMPSVIFMLWPPDAYPRDRELVADLFRQVQQATAGLAGQPEPMLHAVERVVAEWLSNAQGQISGYFLNRFHTRRGVLNEYRLPQNNAPVEPEGFRQLSLRQACMIVGVLIEQLGAAEAA